MVNAPHSPAGEPPRRTRAGAAWLRSRTVAVAPLLAAAAVLAMPCGDCPEHTGHHAATAASAVEQGGVQPGGPSSRGLHARHARLGALAHQAPADGSHGSQATAAGSGDGAFEVGTADRPLVTRGARGPLWAASTPSAPGTGPHGTPAQRSVAAQLERLRHPGAADRPPAADLAAARAALSTAQATKRLSKKCQKLVKITKASKVKQLRKADRKARSKCLEQRRKLIADSKKPPTGATAPASPIQGPAPTTAPPATTPEPAATTPAPTTPEPTTPAAPSKTYAAAGVEAQDGDVPFRLSRSSATADIVNFELDNTDRQDHDLFIAPANASGEITGPLVQIIGRIEGGTRASADVELAPGIYRLICTVPGHGPMAVRFTVHAPPAS